MADPNRVLVIIRFLYSDEKKNADWAWILNDFGIIFCAHFIGGASLIKAATQSPFDQSANHLWASGKYLFKQLKNLFWIFNFRCFPFI